MIDDDLLTRTVRLASADPEFQLLAQHWTGSVCLAVDDERRTIAVDRGAVTMAAGTDSGTFLVSGPVEVWERVLATVPPPGHVDFTETARYDPAFAVEPRPADAVSHLLLRRCCDLLRHALAGTDPAPRPVRAAPQPPGTHDQRTGHYVHLDLDGTDTTVYYEQAGSGIPLLCQHTAGADSRQWRHLLEDPRVTSRYRVIAYDLPQHGKSSPPASVAWWAQEYLLTTERAMAVPVGLLDALDLDDAVFLGSSVGGMLALDLARWHAERFRAVVALEGGLRVPGGAEVDTVLRRDRFADTAWYAAHMWGAMAPTAPEPYRHETRLHYAQGGPGIFSGDSHYYLLDHDLTIEAEQIDTTRCAVHLLTGEYDWISVPLAHEAAARIRGAHLQIMAGLGHFPMSEDHDQLMRYLLPVLDGIAAGS